MKHHQKQKLQDLAQSTAGHLEQFGQSLQHTLAAAPEKIEQIRETLGPPLDHIHETLKHFEKKAGDGSKVASDWGNEAGRRGNAAKQALLSPSTSGRCGDKLLWLMIGMSAGAILGLLLAPASGRHSRAKMRNKLDKKRHDLARATSHRTADLSNKAQGLSHKIKKSFEGQVEELATDEILADRVRTALGQIPDKSLPHLNIDASNGVITLYGPTVNAAQEEQLIQTVEQVDGVLEVASKLPVSSE